MSNDPWKHRSKGIKCNTCIWFVLKRPDEPGIIKRPFGYTGRCRRRAPVVRYGYPVVFELDWCGDHKLNENEV